MRKKDIRHTGVKQNYGSCSNYRCNRICVLMLFVTLLTAMAEATETVILQTGEWAPYCSKTLPQNGLFPEIIREVFKISGKACDIQFEPYKRCEVNVEDGRAWATFPYRYTRDRAETYFFTDHLDHYEIKLFYYGPNGDDYYAYKTFDDLRRYNIGNIMTFYYYDPLRQLLGKKAIHCIDEVDAFQKMIWSAQRGEHGRGVELVPTAYLVGLELIKNKFSDDHKNIHALQKPLEIPGIEYDSKMRLMVSKTYPNSQQILKVFNKALAVFKKRPAYAQILNKYKMPAPAIATQDNS